MILVPDTDACMNTWCGKFCHRRKNKAIWGVGLTKTHKCAGITTKTYFRIRIKITQTYQTIWKIVFNPKLSKNLILLNIFDKMLLGDILNIIILVFGSIFGVFLAKLLLKFYSTILFADVNIFTHLNRATVVAIQIMVQSRVGVLTRHFLMINSSDFDRDDFKNKSSARLHRNSNPDDFCLRNPPSLCNVHLQHSLQDGSHL